MMTHRWITVVATAVLTATLHAQTGDMSCAEAAHIARQQAAPQVQVKALARLQGCRAEAPDAIVGLWAHAPSDSSVLRVLAITSGAVRDERVLSAVLGALERGAAPVRRAALKAAVTLYDEHFDLALLDMDGKSRRIVPQLTRVSHSRSAIHGATPLPHNVRDVVARHLKVIAASDRDIEMRRVVESLLRQLAVQ